MGAPFLARYAREVGIFYLICTNSSVETAAGSASAGRWGDRHESKIET